MKYSVLIFLVCAVMQGCSKKQPQLRPVDEKIMVKTTTVVAASSDESYNYSGTVEALQSIPLSFRTAGTVEKVFVETGDPVRPGQLLATLDQADLLNIYNSMKVKYGQARDAYDRLKQVYDQGSLPEIKWVDMKSTYEQAEQSLELARNNLDKCKLVAPVGGTIGKRNIEPGQSSINLTGAPIEIVKLEKVLIKVSVPEKEINQIRNGQQAQITVQALDGRQYTGTVTNISPVADLISRTYTVKIEVANNDRQLKPGMVCDARLTTGRESTALIVPGTAVSRDSDGSHFVYVVTPDGTRARKTPVNIGNYNSSGIEIRSGLTEGQLIVSEGLEKLSDNSLISR